MHFSNFYTSRLVTIIFAQRSMLIFKQTINSATLSNTTVDKQKKLGQSYGGKPDSFATSKYAKGILRGTPVYKMAPNVSNAFLQV